MTGPVIPGQWLSQQDPHIPATAQQPNALASVMAMVPEPQAADARRYVHQQPQTAAGPPAARVGGSPAIPLPPGMEPAPSTIFQQPVVTLPAAAGSLPVPQSSGHAPQWVPVAPTAVDAAQELSAEQRQALQEISARMGSTLNRIAVGEIACTEGARLLNAEHVSAIVPSEGGPRVLWTYAQQQPSFLWGPQTLAALLTATQPVRRVLAGDPLLNGQPSSLLVVPMVAAASRVGVLVARRLSEHGFSLLQQSVLDRVGRIAAGALENLEKQGLLPDNNGALLASKERLEHDLETALRPESGGMPAALVVARLEGGDRLRADYGEQAGEDAVDVASSALGASLRAGDVAYRMGPNDIAVVLGAIQRRDVASVAARLMAVANQGLAQWYAADYPLRVHAALIEITGSARSILDQAGQALQHLEGQW